MKNNNFRITTTQLAKICNVSQGTVDRALNDRKGINPKTKEHVLKVAKEYGYRPNIHARNLAGGKSMLIGIVVFDLKNEYFSNLIMEIEKCCKDIGYSTIVMFSHKDKQCEIECLEQLYFMGVDGIILCPINDGIEFSNYVQSFHIPTVTVGNKIDHLCFAGINDYEAMSEATSYVIGKGYDHIVYVSASLPENCEFNAYAQIMRYHGFLDVCKNYALEYQVTFDVNKASKYIRQNKKNAVLCSTDHYALKLLPFANNKKVGIMGFDNISALTDYDLRLDSVSYHSKEIAGAAMNILLKKAKTTFVEHSIVKRGSI